MKKETIETARSYYNSSDADNFYYKIWGGEDIHIGLYTSESESIRTASERTVATMASMVTLTQGSNLIDLGSGYGGAARWLATRFKIHVCCLNLSEVQNQRNRDRNLATGLTKYIDVKDGFFEEIPAEDNSFQVAWSQDALLHSPDRFKVFQEVDRVLCAGGSFIFTDIMARGDADPHALKPVLDRIHLDSLGSVSDYSDYASRLGWRLANTKMLTPNLITHYSRVSQELTSRRAELESTISSQYIDRMLKGLDSWVAAGKAGVLEWGIMHFTK